MKKTTILLLLLMLIGAVAADPFTLGDGTFTEDNIRASYTLVDQDELDPPADLSATIDEGDVILEWRNPQGPQTDKWLSWSHNDASGLVFGSENAISFDVAHRFDATDLAGYVGNALTQIKFMPMLELQGTIYTVKVWTGGTTTAPEELVHSQTVSLLNVGGWTTLSQMAPLFTNNWFIQSFVADGRSLKNIATHSRTNERAILTGYKIYRDGNLTCKDEIK